MSGTTKRPGLLPGRYGVIGHPVEHSLSPTIHTLFAKQTRIFIDYQKILIPKDALAENLIKLQKQGFKGLSVTLPFKEEAYASMNACSRRAEKNRCINTITFKEDNTLLGDNTDGIGLLRDLKQNKKLSLENKHILIFGAGGAVRNILFELLNENPRSIVIANRSVERAETLCRDMASNKITSCGLNHTHEAPFNLIINGTTLSLSQKPLPLTKTMLHKNTVYYDLAYGEKTQIILKAMRTLGIHFAYDGLGMLIEQAAEQFYLWHGIRPDTQTVINTCVK